MEGWPQVNPNSKNELLRGNDLELLAWFAIECKQKYTL